MCCSYNSLWIHLAVFNWFRYFFSEINCNFVIFESYYYSWSSFLRIIIRILEKKIMVNTLFSFDGIDDHWFRSRNLPVRRWGIWSVRDWFPAAIVHFIESIHRYENELIFFEFNWTPAKCTGNGTQWIELSGWSIGFFCSMYWCDCQAGKCYYFHREF